MIPCRSKPTQELKGRKPRLGVKSELQSQDQFDQFGFQAVGDVASSQPEDNVFYHGPAILRTPDPQPAPHSSRAPSRLPYSTLYSLSPLWWANESKPNQVLRARTPIKDVPTTPSSDGKGQWLSPESIVGCTTVVPLKWGQIAPGDWVLRIRPPQTILKGTSDEADVYDGPWEVLKVEERHRVQHTPMVRKSPSETSKLANSSKASAKLSIPADSLLHKFSQGWVELGQLVKVDASIGQAVTGGFRSSFRGEDGEEYYQVKKVRGVKHEISKVPRTSGNSRSGPVTSIAVPETKKYLVHWAGYPSEDDTWELAQKDQTGGVPVEYICEWREREKDWKEARKAELVRDYYFDV